MEKKIFNKNKFSAPALELFKMAQNIAAHAAYCSAVAQVALYGVHVAALAVQSCGEGGDRLKAAVGMGDDGVALTGERFCTGGANAAGSASNQRGFSCHCFSP